MGLVGLAILTVIVSLLGRERFKPHARVRTYAKDSAGLLNNSPVQLQGIRVGGVTGSRLTGSGDPVRVVEIDLDIMSQFLDAIPEDSLAEVSALNALGDKFINITKGKSPRHVQTGGILPSPPPKETRPEDLLTAFQANIAGFEALLTGIESGQSDLGQFIKDDDVYSGLLDRVTKLQRAAASVTDPDSKIGVYVADEALYENLRTAVRRIDKSLADLEQSELLRSTKAYDDAQASVRDVGRSVRDLRNNKLIKDDELYRKLRASVSSLETSLDRVNSGEGGLGQLVTSAQMYESLEGSAREVQSLLKELQANPRKFLRVRLKVF